MPQQKTARWGCMVYSGDNYRWHPDEYVFRDSYPTVLEIKNIFNVPEENFLRIEFKKHRIYVYDDAGVPICYFYDIEEEQ
jgi:hypothetical protein